MEGNLFDTFTSFGPQIKEIWNQTNGEGQPRFVGTPKNSYKYIWNVTTSHRFL